MFPLLLVKLWTFLSNFIGKTFAYMHLFYFDWLRIHQLFCWNDRRLMAAELSQAYVCMFSMVNILSFPLEWPWHRSGPRWVWIYRRSGGYGTEWCSSSTPLHPPRGNTGTNNSTIYFQIKESKNKIRADRKLHNTSWNMAAFLRWTWVHCNIVSIQRQLFLTATWQF